MTKFIHIDFTCKLKLFTNYVGGGSIALGLVLNIFDFLQFWDILISKSIYDSLDGNITNLWDTVMQWSNYFVGSIDIHLLDDSEHEDS